MPSSVVLVPAGCESQFLRLALRCVWFSSCQSVGRDAVFLGPQRREEGRDVVRLTGGWNADVDLHEWLLASLARRETWTAVS